MKAYQEIYIENLKQIMALTNTPEEIPEDPEAFVEQRKETNARIAALRQENTKLLRESLMPVLDDIVSASEEEAAELEDFAAHLTQGVRHLDLFLNYTVCNALVAYARKHEKRDMLIRQLYYTGMALFYMQQIIYQAGRRDYCWKMSMMFGEAASYIRKYDEIRDADTRGYIHRSMANLALAYRWSVPEEARQKSRAIRRSFEILTDPVYREKTPELPWDVFLYKSHQERTTAMQLLRSREAEPLLVREVMESSEFVWKIQVENSRNKGVRPSARWMLEYDFAQYHCGVITLSQLLKNMEQIYLDRDEEDFSVGGIWANVSLPAYYGAYAADDPSMIRTKKHVLLFMYHQMVRYVQRIPNNQLNGRLVIDLLQGFQAFIEYPDGIQARDFLLDLVVCRDPDIYVYLYLTAEFSGMLMKEALEKMPEALTGVLDCRDGEEVRERSEELLQFTHECGMLHDIGVFLFGSLVTFAGRSRMEEENRIYTYHVYAGRQILSRFGSTKRYMPVALGHHRWFNGRGGYPEEYRREEDPNRQVTDIVSIAAFFTGLLDAKFNEERADLTVGQALARVREGAGTRFSPVFAQLMAGMERELAAYMEDGAVRAYGKAFGMLRGERESILP